MTTKLDAANAEFCATIERGGQPLESQTRIEIYPDGSCIGNPGFGGYGIVLVRLNYDGDIIKRHEASDFATVITTNNRMEMMAACFGLESLGGVTDEPVTVFCDASLIPNAMNDWLAKWKAKGWRKSDGKAVENQDLWVRLENAAAGRNVAWVWVRGHNGTEHNEAADKLAYAAARKAEKKITAQ